MYGAFASLHPLRVPSCIKYKMRKNKLGLASYFGTLLQAARQGHGSYIAYTEATTAKVN